jgi:integrase
MLGEHLLPVFGKMALGSITSHHVAEFRAAMVAEADRLREAIRAAGGRRDHDGLRHPRSNATINYALLMLRMIFRHAVKHDDLTKNPTLTVPRLPKGRNGEDAMRCLSLGEVHRLLEHADDLAPLLHTAVATGLRRGELFALTWDDVDLDARVLHVRRAVGRHRTAQGYRLVTDQPKGKRSRRVELTPDLAERLRTLPSRFAGGLVFPHLGGNVFELDRVNRRFGRVLRRAGLRNVRFHDLRHTYASLLIAASAHPKYIQAQMGHASITTTLNTYGHLMRDVDHGTGAALDRLLRQGAAPDPVLAPAASR